MTLEPLKKVTRIHRRLQACASIWRYRFALLIAFAGVGVVQAETDGDRVGRQFREFCMQESTDRGQRLLDDVEVPTTGISAAIKTLNVMRSDGSWPDLNYASKARSSWEPGDHLTRMLAMVVYARRSTTTSDESQRCIKGIHRALGYWIGHDFKCPNWWYNDIGGPKILGTIALLLDADLEPAEQKYICDTVLVRSKVGSMTGQNRVWLAGNGVMRGVLMHDEALIKKAASVIADEITVTTGEGVQPDWSFHQHGPQQQFGNYGGAFASEMARWEIVLRDTAYAFPEGKTSILRNYLLWGQNWISWNGVMDISACGRQLFPGSPVKKTGAIRSVMLSMAGVDPEHRDEYLQFARRNSGKDTVHDVVDNDLVGDRFFWRSDYLIHRASQWEVSLKMSSSRVIGGETVNDENLSGAHLADGATFIYRTGHEYDDIFPAWDWRLIPGTTERLDDDKLDWASKAQHLQDRFVGGASDGKNGCAALDFHRGGLSAKKAWFFTPDSVICLGADITGAGAVQTTINQCLLKSPVQLKQGNALSTLSNQFEQRIGNLNWIDHAGIRYISLLPPDNSQSIVVKGGPRTGNWRSVFKNPSTPKEDVTASMFTLTIDHGVNPHSANYAYAITGSDKLANGVVKILSNSAAVQSVQVDDRWAAAVFWAAGSQRLSGKLISVDQPCIVLMVDQKITIADPTQGLKSITLGIDQRNRSIVLPTGGQAGGSVTVPE